MATENKVFVPMYGDSFFTTYDNVTNGLDTHVFSSPCMGILFSHHNLLKSERIEYKVFVPMYGDSFFTRLYRLRYW